MDPDRQADRTLLRSCSSWWLGDWLTYGLQHFPDRYKQAMAETTLDYQTLRNYAWVAARFTVSRRRDTMSFQHHAAVAALPPAQQELWLDLASSRHWSLAELRAQLKTVLGQTPPPRPQDMVTLQLKITADRHGRWEAAACQHQAALADWAIHILDQAAAQILSEQNSDPAVVVSGFEQAQVRAGMGPPAAGERSASAGQRMAEPLARLRAVDGNDTKDLAY